MAIEMFWNPNAGQDGAGMWDFREVLAPDERRWIDTQIDPTGTLASDQAQTWTTAPDYMQHSGAASWMAPVVTAMLGAMAGYGALGAAGALGANAGGGAAAAGAAPDLALSGAIPELGWGSASGIPLGAAGGAVPELGALAPAAAGGWTGFGSALAPAAAGTAPASASPGIASQIETALGLPAGTLSTIGNVGSTAGSLLNAANGGGSQSSLGGLLGTGIGGLLGYLDAKNQPDSLTITKEIDPRLAEFAYGPNGVANAATSLLNNAPAPPSWESLVNQSKAQWDANPWITQQQNAITDMMTRNLNENVLPGIGTQADYAGGYGGSRQGVAEALAISRMNQDLAPALSNLASNAWESSQNRALTGANLAGNYEMQAPWNNITQASNVMARLPGNMSETQPLFSNPWSSALGGALYGGKIGSGVNWADLFKTIGGLFGGGK